MTKKDPDIPTDRYRAAHIANFILKKAESDCISIDPLKLLKLVYIFFGWCSCRAFYGRYIFDTSRDPIQAWQYGPVVPSLYHEFKHFGRNSISQDFFASTFDPFDENDPSVKKPALDENSKLFKTLEAIWGVYKEAPASHLVALTHEEGSPWWITYDGSRDKEIPKELISDYYEDLYKTLGQK